MQADPQTDVPCSASSQPTPGVFDELTRVVTFARETLANFLELASLEARGAGLALVWMIASALIAAVLIVMAWAGLMAALAMFIVSLGMLPIAAAIMVAALNLAAAGGVLWWCVGLARHLLFAATRRQLTGASPAIGGGPTP